MDYPLVQITAVDVTDPEVGCSLQMRFDAPSFPIPGVTEQDVVDAVKDFLSQQPNISVTATRYEVMSSPV
ncbi:hypothetical protein GCM10010372_30470 [Streptomyces tauricus]|uniref:hypothetical protein n=1 Tax=Streptomyces tauricus TaxID=68274 RepID=UPI0016769B74|nr:hypothetical protein [Streptomyces tauricus]GHA28593.1 hypothetical protein GCM10010372_30470 [Streptomyces tauricus]